MRTILITGPGGGGRTTLAAATALSAARAGSRVLLLGVDRDDALGAALGASTGPRPVAVADRLTVLRPDPARGFRADLTALQDRASAALDLLGARRLDPEEFAPPPGAEELALLRAVRDAVHESRHDVLVVDLPPAPRALALLGLPEELRRCLGRLAPPERQAARALRPVLGRLAGVPLPDEGLYETLARWRAESDAAEAVLAAPDTTVRLVAEPGPAGAEAVRTAALGLSLRGLRLELVLANRVLPEEAGSGEGPWAGLVAQQRRTEEDWRRAFPVRRVPHLGRDPRGTADLAALGAPGVGPAGDPVRWPVSDLLSEAGVLVWHLPLPGAVREEVELVRNGDELVVTAGPFRRVVPLPSALRRCAVEGAALREGELRVRFVPDPGQWPRVRAGEADGTAGRGPFG
ncbi:ArsA-related P-loop ATPase [Streptomyces sp. ZYX-F-203]